jgi:hypothetical protein
MWDEAPLSMNQKSPVPPVMPLLGGRVEGVHQRGVDLRQRRCTVIAGWGGVDQRRVIRCNHIYNFLCSMLVLHQLLYVLFTLCGIFMHFLELTY